LRRLGKTSEIEEQKQIIEKVRAHLGKKTNCNMQAINGVGQLNAAAQRGYPISKFEHRYQPKWKTPAIYKKDRLSPRINFKERRQTEWESMRHINYIKKFHVSKIPPCIYITNSQELHGDEKTLT